MPLVRRIQGSAARKAPAECCCRLPPADRRARAAAEGHHRGEVRRAAADKIRAFERAFEAKQEGR